MRGSLFGCLFVAIAGPALANPGPIDGQILRFPMQSYAGHFREHCMTLPAGRTLKLTVRTPQPVKVNVHYHTPDSTDFLFNRVFGDAESETLTAAVGGEYCIEVTNAENRASAFDVRLEVELPAV